MVEGHQKRPGRHRWWTPTRAVAVLAATFVVVSAVALVVPMVRGASSPSRTVVRIETSFAPVAPPPPAAGRATSLAVVCVRTRGDDYCERYTRDIARRQPLTGAERAQAEAPHQQIMAALPLRETDPPFCLPPNGPCAVRVRPPDAEQLRRALVDAGHRDALVRTARADDPAPVGSVLFAVPIGPACVLAHVDTTGPQSTVTGRLPDGGCLAR